MKNFNAITGLVIEKAIEVHRELGPGLMESAYQACLVYELSLVEDIKIEAQKRLPVHYKEVELEVGYRLDILADERVIVEVKAVDKLAPIHMAQLLTYLKISGCSLGLLLNFNIVKMKDGIKRMVNHFPG